jgi:16S rRNA (guanine1516-N2)-methyltransferase
MRIVCVSNSATSSLSALALQLDIPLLASSEDIQSYDYFIVMNNDVLQLCPVDKHRGGPLLVDFQSASTEYRRTTSGIKQDIAKAVGCKPAYRPRVLDVTAGLGGDAFILASVGCDVSLLENNGLVYALLADGIKRAEQSGSDVAVIVNERLHLLAQQDACDFLKATTDVFDVVYLDPMFPERQKSAKVKKAMQYFHDVVGCYHEQESELFFAAMQNALHRVVVKRPKLAPLLANQAPSYQVKGKSVRYDIYLTR